MTNNWQFVANGHDCGNVADMWVMLDPHPLIKFAGLYRNPQNRSAWEVVWRLHSGGTFCIVLPDAVQLVSDAQTEGVKIIEGHIEHERH